MVVNDRNGRNRLDSVLFLERIIVGRDGVGGGGVMLRESLRKKKRNKEKWNLTQTDSMGCLQTDIHTD